MILIKISKKLLWDVWGTAWRTLFLIKSFKRENSTIKYAIKRIKVMDGINLMRSAKKEGEGAYRVRLPRQILSWTYCSWTPCTSHQLHLCVGHCINFVMLCHVMLCHLLAYYVMSCNVMSCYVMLCCVMSCNVMSCYVMLCYVMLCHVMSCNVMSCYVMLCYVMLCYVMLCYVMLCYVLFCYDLMIMM